MKEWYQMREDEVLEALGSDANGLSSEKAEALLKAHGENVLRETKKKSVWRVFAEQFADLLVIILIIAAIISMISGNVESTIVIFAVITMNAILGTVQHEKAEKSLASLKTLSAPTAKVLRGGVKGEIPSAQVVKGDILLLEAGDMVTADGRILESYSLQVNESSLTGESTNVEKKTVVLEGEKALGDRINMVYSGSLVTGGRAVVLVTATGMETEIGKIAALMNATKEKRTPLQVSLDKFGSQLAIVIMIISAVVFVLSLYRKMSVLDSLMFAVALAVAAIPEALSSIVTIVQAMGTQKMVREHAIIKDLKAVESLGCVSVICSDKTGTLTQNKMTVQQVYINHQTMEADALDLKQQSHRYLLYDAILTNDSAIVEGQSIGDPTEVALLEMGRKADIKEDIGLAGIEVYDLLRDEYDIQIELGDIANILAYISIGDRIQDIERLVGALADIKRLYAKNPEQMPNAEYIKPTVCVSPQTAFYGEKKSVPIRETEGMICSEFVMCYPPGIPILAPGEMITREIIDYIIYAKEKGCSMQGMQDPAVESLFVLTGKY